MATTQRQPAANVAAKHDELHRLFEWPEQPPDVESLMHGWFVGHDVLPYFCNKDTRLIVELGSWLGMSARWFCQYCPNATVVCVDHWQGSPEFNGRWDLIAPKSYDLFLKNMWPYRDRVIPLRMSTVEGIQLLESVGASPDLVFVDAGHSEADVYADVTACLDAFPGCQLVGDDWGWKSVQRGIAHVGIEVGHDRRFWWTV